MDMDIRDPMLSDDGSLEPRNWLSTSASDDPVSVDTGLVLLDVSAGSKLVREEKDALLS